MKHNILACFAPNSFGSSSPPARQDPTLSPPLASVPLEPAQQRPQNPPHLHQTSSYGQPSVRTLRASRSMDQLGSVGSRKGKERASEQEDEQETRKSKFPEGDVLRKFFGSRDSTNSPLLTVTSPSPLRPLKRPKSSSGGLRITPTPYTPNSPTKLSPSRAPFTSPLKPTSPTHQSSSTTQALSPTQHSHQHSSSNHLLPPAQPPVSLTVRAKTSFSNLGTALRRKASAPILRGMQSFESSASDATARPPDSTDPHPRGITRQADGTSAVLGVASGRGAQG
jgi:hypothetical protein